MTENGNAGIQPANEGLQAENSGINFDASLTPEVQELVQKKGFKSLGDLAKSYMEAESYIGKAKSQLNIPEELDDEAKNTILSALGRPEKPDDYSFEYDGSVKVDEELLEDFKKFAHEIGLTKDQFEPLVKFQLSIAEMAEQRLQEQRKAAQEELRKKYGADFEANVKSAYNTAKALGIFETLEQKGLSDDADVIDMLVNISKKIGEEEIKPSTVSGQKTPQEELEEIVNSDAYVQKFHPEHQQAVMRVIELSKIIAGQA